MKKSIFKYFITTLLLVIFGSITFLPCFMTGLREQSRYSINKEKTEKEGQEKDSSGESKADLSVYLIANQDDDHLISLDIHYSDRDESKILTRSLSVLSPPPDQA